MDPIAAAISLAQNVINTTINGLSEIINTRGGAFVKAYEARTKAYEARTKVLATQVDKPASE